MAKVLDDRARNIARRPVLLELRSSTRFIVLSASIAFFQDGFLYGSVRYQYAYPALSLLT